METLKKLEKINRRNKAVIIGMILAILVATVVCLFIGTSGMTLAEGAGAQDFLILAVTMLANFVLEFLFCKFVVFRGQEDTLQN